jgi:predicted ArsR family transcriptional regulator
MHGLNAYAAQLGALEDEVRRRMYLFIRDRGRPVSREDAARAVGISRKLAAFHLDKLVDKGLLKAHYARPPGRTGPGAGRPAKLYEPSDLEIEVSIPERHYDLVGHILVGAVANRSSEESPAEAALRHATETGESLGREVRRARGLHPAGAERALSVAGEVLGQHGFEPCQAPDGEVTLRNCPFHALAQEAPELVCGINRAFVDGLLRGLGNKNVEAALEPEPGRCCVKLRPPEARR